MAMTQAQEVAWAVYLARVARVTASQRQRFAATGAHEPATVYPPSIDEVKHIEKALDAEKSAAVSMAVNRIHGLIAEIEDERPKTKQKKAANDRAVKMLRLAIYRIEFRGMRKPEDSFGWSIAQ